MHTGEKGLPLCSSSSRKKGLGIGTSLFPAADFGGPISPLRFLAFVTDTDSFLKSISFQISAATSPGRRPQNRTNLQKISPRCPLRTCRSIFLS